MKARIQFLSCIAAMIALPTAAFGGLYGTVNDFDTPGGTPYTIGVVGGSPGEVAGGAMGEVFQFTDGGTDQQSRIGFDQTAGLASNAKFGDSPVVLIDFDFRLTPSIGQADGMYLALLRVADDGSTGAGTQYGEDPNIVTAGGPNFAIGIDIYDNGDGDPSNNHVSLYYGGLQLVADGLFDLSTDVFHHMQVRLAFREDGTGADVTLTLQENSLGMNGTNSGGLLGFAPAFIPGLTPYDYRVGVGARTGNETAVQQIDNLNVKNGATAFAFAGDFRARAGEFTTVGATFRTDNGGGSYQEWLNLTNNATSQIGSAWLNEKQAVVAGFTTDFEWRINFLAGGADGLAFVVQNVGTGINPGEGGHANNALSVVFDTWGDQTDYEHLRVLDGNAVIADIDLATFGFDFDLDPLADQYAGRYDVRIDYMPGDLDVWLDGILVLDSLNVDLRTLANGSAVDANGYAWLGFSARTGGAAENHDILTWHFASFVPAPSALPAGLALLTLVAARRRRA